MTLSMWIATLYICAFITISESGKYSYRHKILQWVFMFQASTVSEHNIENSVKQIILYLCTYILKSQCTIAFCKFSKYMGKIKGKKNNMTLYNRKLQFQFKRSWSCHPHTQITWMSFLSA